MLNNKEYLLIQIASEAAEVAHRATKALHFGVNEVQAGQPHTNLDRMGQELVDLVTSVAELERLLEVCIFPENCETMSAEKRMKIAKYMSYARSIGTLEP